MGDGWKGWGKCNWQEHLSSLIALQKHLCGCGLLLTKMPPCSHDCVIKRKGTRCQAWCSLVPRGTYRIVDVKHGKGSGPREVSGKNCQNRRKGWDCNKAHQARCSGSRQTLPSSRHHGLPSATVPHAVRPVPIIFTHFLLVCTFAQHGSIYS